MKRSFIVILIIFIQSVVALAQNADIDAIETSLYGYDYKNESDNKRVERLEKHLYGHKKSGNILKRIENIKNDIGFVEIKETTKEEINKPIANQNIKNDIKNELLNMKEDASVDYPIVDKLEEEIFKTNYKSENIYSRLDRLEKQVFNKTSNESLTDRVDKLSSVIMPKKISKRSEEHYTSNEIESYYRKNGLEEINNQTLPFQLAVLEEDILKKNYQNENISTRLSRIENNLFNRTYHTDTDIERLQRIIVAYDAKQKSYKYENNRKMQNMATVSQLGGILLMILAMIL